VGNIPDTAVEEGTADGDEDAGGDKLIASDDDPDYESPRARMMRRFLMRKRQLRRLLMR
jgi:hypothetical protein